MTTPNIAMPYGYTVGGQKDQLWQSRADGGSANIDLPEGPCRVLASWAGPEQATLNLLGADGGKTVLDTIEKKAGGVPQFADGHGRRGQGRPSAPRMLTAHNNHCDGHYRGPSHPVRLAAKAVV